MNKYFIHHKSRGFFSKGGTFNIEPNNAISFFSIPRSYISHFPLEIKKELEVIYNLNTDEEEKISL